MHHSIIEIGTSLWWKGMLFSIAGILVILLIARFSNDHIRYSIRMALAILLIAIKIYLPIFQLGRGEWDIQTALPLNLCSLSGILSGLVLLYRHQLAYECLLYWGMSGATYSLITPEMTLGNSGWYLYDYYISHAGIIASCLYLTYICKMFPRPLSWAKIFVYTQIPVLIVAFIDKGIGANYMYLMQKPAVKNPFVIGAWPWYVVGIEMAGLLHFFVVYLLFFHPSEKRENTFIKNWLSRKRIFANFANSISSPVEKIRNR